MRSEVNARQVWEDVYRQTHNVVICLRKNTLKFLLCCLVLYTIFAVSGTLTYIYQHGLSAKTSAGKPETRVIMLTYMRSGSTFTSELIQTHPDVFFVFEPLHMVWYYQPKIYAFLNRPRKLYFQGEFWRFTEEMKLETMYHALRCSFQNLDIMTLLQHHWYFSKTTINYKYCTTRLGGVTGLENCVSRLTTACRKAKVNLIKTINFTMSGVEQLMSNDPNLKLIHLVRDPRATIWSQRKLDSYSPRQLEEHSQEFCHSVLLNVLMYARLKSRYPERMAFVRYEDIAYNPLLYTKKLYDFVGLSLADDIRQHIISITSNGKDEHCAMCTSKANSSKASEEWRREVVYKFVQAVDARCKELYPHIGYKLVPNLDMLNNASVSLLTSPLQLNTL